MLTYIHTYIHTYIYKLHDLASRVQVETQHSFLSPINIKATHYHPIPKTINHILDQYKID